jgi:hypothetical protein
MDVVNMIGRRPQVYDYRQAHAKGTSSHEAALGHKKKVGARYTPVPGAQTAESSGSSEHADHRYGTP